MIHNGVLLVGGGGFIGSALARRLKQDQIPVHVIGRSNLDQLSTLLAHCATVVHLASCTTPGSSSSQPDLELANLQLTLHLLKLMQSQPQTHIIFFSSGGTVYGNPSCLPVSEDSLVAPLSYHGAGKVAQEAYLQTARSRGHHVTILRPSNAYGPGQNLRSGFGLIRTLLEHARLGTMLEIWGDGENVRDFIYIDDVVAATVRLIESSNNSETYNVGSGQGHSLKQVIEAVEAVTCISIQARYQPARVADVRQVVLDNSRAINQLRWKPAVGLVDGITRTWQWLQGQP